MYDDDHYPLIQDKPKRKRGRPKKSKTYLDGPMTTDVSGCVLYGVNDMVAVRNELREMLPGYVIIVNPGDEKTFWVVCYKPVEGARNGGSRSHPGAALDLAIWREEKDYIVSELLAGTKDIHRFRTARNRF